MKSGHKVTAYGKKETARENRAAHYRKYSIKIFGALP